MEFLVNAEEVNTSEIMSLSYSKFTGQRGRDFNLTEGHILYIDVTVTSNSGILDIYIIKDEDYDNCFYENIDAQTFTDTIKLTEAGSYYICVYGEDHSGGYVFEFRLEETEII